MSVRTAVFPVAGLGTRFRPATKAVPKEMLPVVDKPLIQYAVEEARDAGIENFVFITAHGKVAIENHFDVSYELESLLSGRNDNETLALLDGVASPEAVTRQLYSAVDNVVQMSRSSGRRVITSIAQVAADGSVDEVSLG